jgi:hypothetical protein
MQVPKLNNNNNNNNNNNGNNNNTTKIQTPSILTDSFSCPFPNLHRLSPYSIAEILNFLCAMDSF